MRKRLITPAPQTAGAAGGDWLDLEALADVEVTSEDPAHPIEGALLPGGSPWRAAGPGPQTIRLLFTPPQTLRLIGLTFIETEAVRTQEYVLRWSADGQAFRDLVRQQWNFSPGGATTQAEEHRVELASVAALELTIVPEIGGGSAVASLAQLRLR